MKKIELDEWEEVRGRLERLEKGEERIRIYLDISCNLVTLEYPINKVYDDLLEDLEKLVGSNIGILQTDDYKRPIRIVKEKQ